MKINTKKLKKYLQRQWKKIRKNGAQQRDLSQIVVGMIACILLFVLYFKFPTDSDTKVPTNNGKSTVVKLVWDMISTYWWVILLFVVVLYILWFVVKNNSQWIKTNTAVFWRVSGICILLILLCFGGWWIYDHYRDNSNDGRNYVTYVPSDVLSNTECRKIEGKRLSYNSPVSIGSNDTLKFVFGKNVLPHFILTNNNIPVKINIFCLNSESYSDSYSYEEVIDTDGKRTCKETGIHYANDVYGVTMKPAGTLTVVSYAK